MNIDPRRSAVGLWNKNDVQSFFRFAIIEVDLSQFLFFFDVLLAINLGMSRKSRWADGELNCAVGSHVVDCFLSAWRVHVKNAGAKFRDLLGRNIVSGSCESMFRNRSSRARRSIVLRLGGFNLFRVKLLHRSLEI